tara:strand:- start:403 stop:1026 length:624 start_codon:yes stop_codon:yes gene_type:complete
MIYMIKLLLVLLAISSCANIPISYQDLPETFYRAAFGYPDIAIDQETYNENKYSFAKVRLGKASPVIMILLSIDDGMYTWIDKEGLRLITLNGRIIKTIGLPNDINIKVDKNKKQSNEGQFYETINFSNPVLMNADLSSVISFEEKIDLLYLDDLIEVNIYSEEVSISAIGWREENLYFLDNNNREIKTIQFIHPFLKQIDMEFYYK